MIFDYAADVEDASWYDEIVPLARSRCPVAVTYAVALGHFGPIRLVQRIVYW